MKVFVQSDVGKVRPSNQDSVCGGEFANGAWAAVCDGMGGPGGGEIASTKAIEVIKEVIAQSPCDDMSKSNVEDVVRSAVAKANRAVFELALKDSSLRGMGTTLVLAIVVGDKLYTAHAGDSRAYIVNAQGLHRLTKDHSVVQQMVDNGEISREEAETHPKKNIITRALGVNPFIEIDFAQHEYTQDSTVILCSDGLTNHLTQDDILEYYSQFEGEELCRKLVDAANTAGGKDNISVAIISGEQPKKQ